MVWDRIKKTVEPTTGDKEKFKFDPFYAKSDGERKTQKDVNNKKGGKPFASLLIFPLECISL